VYSPAAPEETDLLHFAGAKEQWSFNGLCRSSATTVPFPPFLRHGGHHRTKHAEEALRDGEQRLQREFLNVQRAKKEWEVTFDTLRDPSSSRSGLPDHPCEQAYQRRPASLSRT